MSAIQDNVRRILAELPPGVELAAAAKTRTPAEIIEAVEAGIRIIGENYVQEAQTAREAVGPRALWSLIGHLQSNKAKKAVEIFDMVETVDSIDLARELDKRCAARSCRSCSRSTAARKAKRPASRRPMRKRCSARPPPCRACASRAS
jgi:uncharacterized pyridoxal phosphate-containing UPF0001 family protein